MTPEEKALEEKLLAVIAVAKLETKLPADVEQVKSRIAPQKWRALMKQFAAARESKWTARVKAFDTQFKASQGRPKLKLRGKPYEKLLREPYVMFRLMNGIEQPFTWQRTCGCPSDGESIMSFIESALRDGNWDFIAYLAQCGKRMSDPSVNEIAYRDYFLIENWLRLEDNRDLPGLAWFTSLATVDALSLLLQHKTKVEYSADLRPIESRIKKLGLVRIKPAIVTSFAQKGERRYQVSIDCRPLLP